MDSDKALTRLEFDDVMRRAAELAAQDPDAQNQAFSRDEVLRIGKDVGLPEEHVRRALAEVGSRRGGLEKTGSSRLKALFGSATVWASRTIDRPKADIVAELDEFLVAGRLLQPVRRGEEILQYRPAVDWASRVARTASATSRQHYIAAARLVEVRLEELSKSQTHVEFLVDPGIQGDYQAGVFFGGGFPGVAAGIVTVAIASPALPVVAAAAAAGVVGLGVATGIAAMMGRAYDRRIGEVLSEIEGVLDSLESGKGLEPPPPAWRRWVKRHFHGAAKDVLRDL